MNTNLFQTLRGKLVPAAPVRNEAGGVAYAPDPRHMLAQVAATGCMNRTFYATVDEQLKDVLALAQTLPAEFVAKTAIYARQQGYMKDMPALLCAVLASRDRELLKAAFPRVMDNARMVRNFVQIIRSGVTGRKSLGTLPKRLVRDWIAARSDEQLFADSVGQAPSLADIIRMVHPRPAGPEREALYAYLIGRVHNDELLPPIVRAYEAYKMGHIKTAPNVPFQMLTALELAKADWIEIARTAPWQMTRMNLNTFARHGVFDNREVTRAVASRLASAELVRKARVFPYQLLAAYKSAGNGVPEIVRNALQDAMEIATANVPRIDGKVYIFPDVSGSMQSPVTGQRGSATTAVRCIDVAALVAATIMRRNRDAEVLPFGTGVCPAEINPRDSIMTNAQKLAALNGGGTNCSAPLAELNRRKAQGDLVVYVSDNESWADPQRGRGTATMAEWAIFQGRNPNARLVCIDIQPYVTTQAAERADILNVGGFSDQVFTLLARFAEGNLSGDHWVGEIEKVTW
ncbi:MAG: RNA-binding protein [Verrucomicrobiota bacterium]